MKIRLFCPFVAAWIFTVLCAQAQDGIRLKVRTLRPGPAAPPVRVGRDTARTHFLVQFRSYPDRNVRELLTRRGFRITGYVPDDTLMVSAAPGADLNGLDVNWTGGLDPEDKLSPQLAAALTSAYVVIFHSDVDSGEIARLVQVAGVDSIPNPHLLPNHLLIAGSYAQVTAMAADDALAYILPASADLVAGYEVAGCAGGITEAGPVAEYVQVGTGWAKDAAGAVSLGYFFQSLPEKLDEATVRSEVERAFREWERYAPIQLTPAQQADAARTIAIRFARGAHGDSYPFDGPGGTLAHTFYPVPPNSEPTAGDMHLDADEPWGVASGVDLYSVVLHETGHALGLGHTDMPGAVMYPYYRVAGGLTADDIAGIQAIYGSGPAGAPNSGPGTAADPPDPGTPSLPPPTNPTSPTEPTSPSLPPPGTPTTPTVPATPTNPAAPPITPPPSADQRPPSLAILSPASTIVSTSASTLAVSGTAGDDVGVTAIRWSTSNGDQGTASGTTAWTAAVPLLVGTNVVTVRAFDAAGNSSWRAVTVVRR